jgi:hypothetical protein
MTEPYHKELHEILIRKGWTYQRVNRSIDGDTDYDYYLDKFNDREILFFEDETIQSFENGVMMKIKTFDEVTNNIFE